MPKKSIFLVVALSLLIGVGCTDGITWQEFVSPVVITPQVVIKVGVEISPLKVEVEATLGPTQKTEIFVPVVVRKVEIRLQSTNMLAPSETIAVFSSPVPTQYLDTLIVTPTMAASAIESQKQITIDISEQTLEAYVGNTLVMTTAVSTGLVRTPTPIGTFRIREKMVADDMSGPGYYLTDVPYTMYFYGSYAIHGTYWHSNFGHPMSHGCVNLPTEKAQWLFEWVDPTLPEGKTWVRATEDNPGTLVVVRE